MITRVEFLYKHTDTSEALLSVGYISIDNRIYHNNGHTYKHVWTYKSFEYITYIELLQLS